VTDSVISFEADPPSTEEMARRMESTLATHPWLVFERDGQVVGYAYGGPHHPRAAYRWSADVSVYVDRGLHRQGIGRALYEDLLERLRGLGIRMACGGVTLPNEGSVGLHESLGFEPVGIYREIGWKAGEWWDVGWWQLDLGKPAGDPPPEPLTGARGV
jgi:phosphinothricin acetyltransferase